MNILVTGGAGFIGSHTVVELINAGHTPIILDNFCNSNASSLEGIEKITGSRPKLYEGDCTDAHFVTSVFEAEAVNGVKVPYAIGHKRAGDIVSCYADPTKIQTNLHWQSKLSLEEALRDAWNWQQQLK
jgi:UDP-glucose 4-epimerase